MKDCRPGFANAPEDTYNDTPFLTPASKRHEKNDQTAPDIWFQPALGATYGRHRRKRSHALEISAARCTRLLSFLFTRRFCLLKPTTFGAGAIVESVWNENWDVGFKSRFWLRHRSHETAAACAGSRHIVQQDIYINVRV